MRGPGTTAARVINVFLSQKKGSCHAPQDAQWGHRLQLCTASCVLNSQGQCGRLACFPQQLWARRQLGSATSTTALGDRTARFLRTGNTYDPGMRFALYTAGHPMLLFSSFLSFCVFLFFFFLLFCLFFSFFCCTKFKVALSGKQWSLADKTFP